MLSFNLRTSQTLAHIRGNISFHIRPPLQRLQILIHLVRSRVDRIFGLIRLMYNQIHQSTISWQPDTISEATFSIEAKLKYLLNHSSQILFLYILLLHCFLLSFTDLLWRQPQHLLFQDDTKFHNHNHLATQSISVVSGSALSDSKYIVNNDNLIANETLSAELERYKERVKLLEERQNVDFGTREKLIIDNIIREKNAQFANFEKEINNLKQTLSEQSKEKELLTKTFNVFKNESKEKEAKNIDTEIALEKKVKELDNIVCKMGQSAQTVHMLTKPQVFYDNNLKQALGFQNPFYLKKAQQITLMMYDDFGKRFVPQQELSNEQALHPIIDQFASSLVKIEAPRKLPKMEAVVQQYNVDKQCFEIQKKQFLIENDRLLDQIISQDIMNIVMNSSVDPNTSMNVNSSVAMIESMNYVEMCNKCLELEAELIKQHNMVEKDEYNRLSKRFSELEQHCISLEIAMQINK
ncbi:hypothetical protein Tco_0847385, partial [Tanacetum coccineum]